MSYAAEGTTPYLTALSQSFWQPSTITGDHELKRVVVPPAPVVVPPPLG
ncbi:hypothetical protein [Streptomyces melanogenes]|nr:hypothetical protein [Streptomyces melanogenes]